MTSTLSFYHTSSQNLSHLYHRSVLKICGLKISFHTSLLLEAIIMKFQAIFLKFDSTFHPLESEPNHRFMPFLRCYGSLKFLFCLDCLKAF